MLATNHTVVAMIKLVVSNVREFLRETIFLMVGLLLYKGFDIALPLVKILVNCIDYTNLANEMLTAITKIINEESYSFADISVSILTI